LHAFDITLADGRRIRLRPPQPGDEVTAAVLFNRLGPRNRRFALRQPASLRSPTAVRQLFSGAQAGPVTWCAVALEQPGRPVVGVARYMPDPGDWTRAELALTTAPEFRRAGLGLVLMETLMLTALERGVTRLEARVSPDNVAARRLFARLQARTVVATDDQLVLEVPVGEGGRTLLSSWQWRALRFETRRAGPG
jgi:RimJ/RimL family protein N-acetyltransferase